MAQLVVQSPCIQKVLSSNPMCLLFVICVHTLSGIDNNQINVHTIREHTRIDPVVFLIGI